MNFIPLIVSLTIAPIIIYFIYKKTENKPTEPLEKKEIKFSKPFKLFLNVFHFLFVDMWNFLVPIIGLVLSFIWLRNAIDENSGYRSLIGISIAFLVNSYLLYYLIKNRNK